MINYAVRETDKEPNIYIYIHIIYIYIYIYITRGNATKGLDFKSRTNIDGYFDFRNIHKEPVKNGHVANICKNVLFSRCSKYPHGTNVCQICHSWEPGFTEAYISPFDSLFHSTRYFQYVATVSQTCHRASSRDNHSFITRTKYFHFTTVISYSENLLRSLP